MDSLGFIATLGPLAVARAWAVAAFGLRDKRASLRYLLLVLVPYLVWLCIVAIAAAIPWLFGQQLERSPTLTVCPGLVMGFVGLAAGAPAGLTALVLLGAHYALKHHRAARSRDATSRRS